MSVEKVLISVLICLTTISWVIDVKARRNVRKHFQWGGHGPKGGVGGNEVRRISDLMAASYASLAGRAGAVGTVAAIVAYLLAKEPLPALVMISTLTIVFILVILFLGMVKAESMTRFMARRNQTKRSGK